MPGVYREKNCPVCGIKHRKRWPCCSNACGQQFRIRTPQTEEARRARSEGMKRFKATDQGQLTNSNLKNQDSEDTVSIIPPELPDTEYFVEDGDVWSFS